MSAKESLARAEAQRDNLRIEKEIVKSSEGRILNELENLRRERHSQSMLMANLQAIQVMKTSDFTSWENLIYMYLV
jgi:hypothetical protein